MKAVILAGGKGTRLKPYTSVIPKPLVPIGEKPILGILIQQLKKCKVDEIVICLNHFAELIIAYFGDGSKLGIKITYSIEDMPLGTVGPIKLINNLPENFLVMNGDLLTDLNFEDLYNYHLNNKELLTVSTYNRSFKIDFGVLGYDNKCNEVISFCEKPEYKYNIGMGVYVMNKKILELVPKNTHFGFDNLMNSMLERRQTIKVFPYEGYWLDVGRPDDYEKANLDSEIFV